MYELKTAPDAGQVWCVGAVIIDARGRAFLQRRGPNRSLSPGCWDIVAGHVESGETLHEALAREILEETGWTLERVVRDLGLVIWTGNDGVRRHEVGFVVEVGGDLSDPKLEWDKHTEYAWFDRADLSQILQSRPPFDEMIHDTVSRALHP
jgi:8-oxo-dGTP pyrophosphatase MutT (NUDIX family)